MRIWKVEILHKSTKPIHKWNLSNSWKNAKFSHKNQIKKRMQKGAQNMSGYIRSKTTISVSNVEEKTGNGIIEPFPFFLYVLNNRCGIYQW